MSGGRRGSAVFFGFAGVDGGRSERFVNGGQDLSGHRSPTITNSFELYPPPTSNVLNYSIDHVLYLLRKAKSRKIIELDEVWPSPVVADEGLHADVTLIVYAVDAEQLRSEPVIFRGIAVERLRLGMLAALSTDLIAMVSPKAFKIDVDEMALIFPVLPVLFEKSAGEIAGVVQPDPR